jgi:cystathionine beta-synthase
MREQGFLDIESHGDLRDLIARPVETHDAIVVRPEEPLSNAYKRMKLYDVSQLPVVEDGRIVGIIDESDLLLAIYDHEERFNDPISSAMVTELESVQVDDPIDTLLPIFNRDLVAIVQRGDEFLGLITRVDLLNFLRRRADR